MNLLVVERGGFGPRIVNHYLIPCCSLRLDELELLTGISGHQILLPFIKPEMIGETIVSDLWTVLGVYEQSAPLGNLDERNRGQIVPMMGTNWPVKGDNLSPKHKGNMGVTKGTRDILTDNYERTARELDRVRGTGSVHIEKPLSEETEKLIAEQLAELGDETEARLALEGAVRDRGAGGCLDDEYYPGPDQTKAT
jgi:hypothetical protein